MDEDSLNLLRDGNKDEALNVIKNFITENNKCFNFPNVTKEQKLRFVEGINQRLLEKTFLEERIFCLEAIRIISREKRDIDEIFTRDVVNLLVELAGLHSEKDILLSSEHLAETTDLSVILESLKALCNLIYNSKAVQRICSSNSCVEGIMLRLKTYKDGSWSNEIKYFDMKMLFILTALCADLRPRLRNEFHGLIYLTEFLDLILKSNVEERAHREGGIKRRFNRGSCKRGWEQQSFASKDGCAESISPPPLLNEEEVLMACEIIKVIFNLTVNVDKHNVDEKEEAHFLRLVCVLHDILLCETKSPEKKEQLQSQVIALLNNMPCNCYEELLTPQTDVNQSGKNNNFDFFGMNVEAVAIVIDFLDKKLDYSDELLNEHLITVLACLTRIAQSNSVIRRYLKSKILPPLKDVMHRPEEGTTMRNKMVRLMTSHSIQIKKLGANFLFILCKENVSRLIKYTGYGNAAGLLASMGLMRSSSGSAGNYSSDSEDSDTEEYLQYKEKINMVTGCYEEPRPSPMEGMTEEQKEYEAMQLVNMIDKLSRDGVMKPMKIGEDGRPYPVDHVLQLRENQ